MRIYKFLLKRFCDSLIESPESQAASESQETADDLQFLPAVGLALQLLLVLELPLAIPVGLKSRAQGFAGRRGARGAGRGGRARDPLPIVSTGLSQDLNVVCAQFKLEAPSSSFIIIHHHSQSFIFIHETAVLELPRLQDL